jgi:hypothetical protein
VGKVKSLRLEARKNALKNNQENVRFGCSHILSMLCLLLYNASMNQTSKIRDLCYISNSRDQIPELHQTISNAHNQVTCLAADLSFIPTAHT